MNHYKWLDKHLDSIWVSVFGKTLSEMWCTGIISAHGDKCYGYQMVWEDAGIPFVHGVAIYLLSYVAPFSAEVRNTDNGFVPVDKWVIDNYQRFLPHLPPAE